MPEQDAQPTVSSQAAADAAGITLAQLRRWCTWHGEYMSVAAKPPPGSARRFTWRDVETLKEIRRLRSERGFTTAAVNDALATFDIVDAPPPDWVADAGAGAGDADDTADDAAPQESTAIVPAALSAIDSRFKAIDSRLDAIHQQVSVRSTDADRLRWMILGAVFAAVAILVALAGIAAIIGMLRP